MMLDHDHHLLLRTCDNQKYYSFFYNLHPMQNTTMRCCPGLKGEITNSNWHLKRFPDEREGGQSKHILMRAANWDLTLTPGWQNENRDLMRGNRGNGVTDNTKSSYTQCFHLLCNLQQYFVKIILLCLWYWKLEPKAVSIWENCAGLHFLKFAEINYISDWSHPYLSTGQLGGNSYDNWKLRSDWDLRRWKNASSSQDWNVKLE